MSPAHALFTPPSLHRMDKMCKVWVKAGVSQCRGQCPALLPSYCMLYVLKYILFTAHEKPQRAVYFFCRIFLERTQDLDSSFSIKNGNLKNPEQDFSGHLLVCSVASVVTTEDILHYAWLTVHKTCLTAAEGWADFKPGHFQLHRTALTVPEAQSQCWAEDRTTPQFGNQASGSQMSHSEKRMHTRDSSLLCFALRWEQNKLSVATLQKLHLQSEGTDFGLSHAYLQDLSSPQPNLFHLYTFKQEKLMLDI